MSWSNTAQFRLPVAAWRQMIAEHYPGGGWIRVQEHTLAVLNHRRAAGGLPSFDLERALATTPDQIIALHSAAAGLSDRRDA